MLKKIYKLIRQYDTIVLARHVGVDPDAMASQIGLRDAIRLTFPEKKVLAVGTGSAKFNYLGKLDKEEEVHDALLIVLDTPDRRRVDIGGFQGFTKMIKIDHHPFVEEFCDVEWIEDTACSACEIVMNLLEQTRLKCNREVAEVLYMGLVSDSNRFLFNSVTSDTFAIVSRYMKRYHLDIASLYTKIYLRPINEVRLEGYIAQNMAITDHGVGYVKVTDEVISKFHVDSASAGNMINNFNFIEEILVWVMITEDVKNDRIRINIRSRGPEINTVAEKYNGGGHKFASGAKLSTFEEAMNLVEDLDQASKRYIEHNNL